MSERIQTVLLLAVLLGVGWLVIGEPRKQPTAQPAPQPIARYSLHLKGTDELIFDSVTGDVYNLDGGPSDSGVFVVFKMNLPSQRVEVYPMQMDPQKQSERVLEYYRKNPPQRVSP
ncbi:MAG TPA: hypothetical protein VLE03_01245 [Nitrospiraceae bacterium]|nr:hypothetical protein [Nitrospiraceae bacterium]